MDLDGILNPTVMGHVLFVMLVFAGVMTLFREVTRLAAKIVLPVAILMGVAIWLGVLDETTAGNALTTVGEGAIQVIEGVATWVANTAFGGNA